MSDLQSRLQSFAARGAHRRAEAWGGKATVSTDLSGKAHCFSMSPPRANRVASEHGAGWIQIVERVIMVKASQGLTIEVGTRFTITSDPLNPHTVGTVWSVQDMGDSDAGSERRCVCYRQDPPNE
jgi:hypothetical protein